jgi:hypothetical protein
LADYFNAQLMKAAGLVRSKPKNGDRLDNDNEEDGEAFEGDEGVWEDPAQEEEPAEESEESEEPKKSPSRGNSAGTSGKDQTAAKKKSGTTKVVVEEEKENDPIIDISIIGNDCTTMRIRMLKHNVRISLDGGHTYIYATRICVYFEMTAGVRVVMCTVEQDPDDPNLVTLSIERSKAMFDPTTIAECFLETGIKDIDDGLVAAAEEDLKLEAEEEHVHALEKDGVWIHQYKFVIPSEYKVVEGFKKKENPLKAENEDKVLYKVELNLRSSKRSSQKTNDANFVACYLLAWTAEQMEIRKKTPMKNRGGQVKQGAKQSVDTARRFEGEYGSEPESPLAENAENPPSPKKRARASASARASVSPDRTSMETQNSDLDLDLIATGAF